MDSPRALAPAPPDQRPGSRHMRRPSQWRDRAAFGVIAAFPRLCVIQALHVSSRYPLPSALGRKVKDIDKPGNARISRSTSRTGSTGNAPESQPCAGAFATLLPRWPARTRLPVLPVLPILPVVPALRVLRVLRVLQVLGALRYCV